MDGHFYIALPAGGHNGFQEVFQVGPQLFETYTFVGLEQLVRFCHSLRLSAGEGALRDLFIRIAYMLCDIIYRYCTSDKVMYQCSVWMYSQQADLDTG